MKRALCILVVTVLWLAPYWIAQPARPEPDAESRIATVMGDDAEEG